MNAAVVAAENDRPLRILLVVNLPWDPRLGAVRVYMELAERWRAGGHIVEVYSFSEAFPGAPGSGAQFAVRQVLFAYKAAAFVRKNNSRFDVVDALIGSLRGTKKLLRFNGLLVARSVGLLRLYARLEPRLPSGRSQMNRGTLAGRILYKLIQRWLQRASDNSVLAADLINVPNDDEAQCLREEINPKLAIEVQPYGLMDSRRHALAAAAASPEERLAQGRLSFIGMWSPRKGAWDWAEILRRIWHVIPEAKFRFLGTMVDPAKMLADVGIRESQRIEVIPQYSPNELPDLLADCAVGILPSYIEGFGLAVIEQLASGIPTVAFNVPGPSQILKELPDLLVTRGDVEAVAKRAIALLQSSPADYNALAKRCRVAAEQFRWETIADDTIAHYRARLNSLGHLVFTEPFGIASASGGGGGRILRSLLRDAPVEVTCISTSPQPLDKRYAGERHLPIRPHFGRIERTRFVSLPHALAPLFRGRFVRRLRSLCREIRARGIHAIAHGGMDFHYSYTVAKQLRIPYFLQVHDDVAYTSGGLASADEISQSLREAWCGAHLRFVISNELGAEYNRRYGKRDFIIVTDGVDEVAPAPRAQPNGFRVYFMGLFHLEYEENVQAMIDALRLIEVDPAVERSLTLRCGGVRASLQQPGVRVLPFGSEADVQADFAHADFLYLPLPFGAEHRAFVAYSLSTKMVTYLGSGIPIVYHGPTGTAAYNLLERHNAAALITTNEPQEIAAALQELFRGNEAATIAANGLELARRDFLRADQHEKFWRPILSCLDGIPAEAT